jgi:hypothetical protein
MQSFQKLLQISMCRSERFTKAVLVADFFYLYQFLNQTIRILITLPFKKRQSFREWWSPIAKCCSSASPVLLYVPFPFHSTELPLATGKVHRRWGFPRILLQKSTRLIRRLRERWTTNRFQGSVMRMSLISLNSQRRSLRIIEREYADVPERRLDRWGCSLRSGIFLLLQPLNFPNFPTSNHFILNTTFDRLYMSLFFLSNVHDYMCHQLTCRVREQACKRNYCKMQQAF